MNTCSSVQVTQLNSPSQIKTNSLSYEAIMQKMRQRDKKEEAPYLSFFPPPKKIKKMTKLVGPPNSVCLIN